MVTGKPKIVPERIASSSSTDTQPSQTSESRSPASSVSDSGSGGLDYSVLQKKKMFYPPAQLKNQKAEAVGDIERLAKEYVISKTKGKISNLKSIIGISHVHLIETFNNRPLVNLAHKVNFDPQGRISSASVAQVDLSKLSLIRGKIAKPVSVVDAVAKVVSAVGIKTARSELKLLNDNKTVTGAPFHKREVKVTPKMLYLPNGAVDSIWEVQVHIEPFKNYLIWVSGTDGGILAATNLVMNLGEPMPEGLSVGMAKNITIPSLEFCFSLESAAMKLGIVFILIVALVATVLAVAVPVEKDVSAEIVKRGGGDATDGESPDDKLKVKTNKLRHGSIKKNGAEADDEEEIILVPIVPTSTVADDEDADVAEATATTAAVMAAPTFDSELELVPIILVARTGVDDVIEDDLAEVEVSEDAAVAAMDESVVDGVDAADAEELVDVERRGEEEIPAEGATNEGNGDDSGGEDAPPPPPPEEAFPPAEPGSGDQVFQEGPTFSGFFP
ncbi:hypothetical protein HDU97_002113 [Phlyctochytrium planicorne]|nr:hypothetical protein HDU97_002113 [Phlyctochytrium planicorne]